MIKLTSKTQCVGCGACAAVCPVGAIAMSYDEEGFRYPIVNNDLCVGCGKCEKACCMLKPPSPYTGAATYHAACLANQDELSEVSSGGAFWAFAETVISKGGIVYGAEQLDVGHVAHKRAETVGSARSFRKSKYLQSDMSDMYISLRDDLNAGKDVLFTGTPCQIAAIRTFLGHDYNNLITCEVVCHGVPSKMAFLAYRQEAEAAEGSQMTGLDCRDKTLGWRSNQYAETYEDGVVLRSPSTTHPFHGAYLKGLMSRPSCPKCPFAKLDRVADITLADFWRYEGKLLEHSQSNGVSLVRCGTLKGERLLHSVKNLLCTEACTEELAISSCRQLTRPPLENRSRAAFLADIGNLGYFETMEKYMSKERGPLATMTSRLQRKKERLGDKAKIVMRKFMPLYSDEERSEVKTYYQSRGKEAVIPSSLTDYAAFYALGTRDKILITPSRPARGIAKLLGKQRMSSESALTKASLHAPMRAALQILSERGIPCYFVNRVGQKKDGYPYTRAARERMRHHLNFPTMASNLSLYEEHLRGILGEKYSKEYIEQLQQIPQVIFKGGKYAHEDASSQLVNTLFGRRVTVGQIDDADLELHVYGRCGVFGYAVEDADTLPSRLQAWLTSLGASVRVENHGLWGGDDACILQNFFQEVESLPSNSVVLFYMRHFEGDLITQYERLGMRTTYITDEWHAYDEARWCFYDKPGHMNALGYDHAAEIIAKMLVDDGFKGTEAIPEEFVADPRSVIRAYAENHGNGDFYQKLNSYLDNIAAQVPDPSEDEVRGAIVMNCNPFTKGHEYLIRKAASEVDRLFVFVVQEDRSIFKFEDRIEMVRRGIAGIENVLVFPSGEFMISTVTFPEYFLKDYVKEKDFDVSGDLELFCQRICPRLGITVRYAGEEPNDPVTAHYNETMSVLLPRYGMVFREVPRLLQKSGEVVNATEVRRRIADGNLETLSELLPESTIEIVRQKYV